MLSKTWKPVAFALVFAIYVCTIMGRSFFYECFSSTLFVYLGYLFLNGKQFSEIDSKYFCRFETKTDLYAWFLKKESKWIFVYVLLITIFSAVISVVNPIQDASILQTIIFFVTTLINLILLSLLLLLLRLVFGAVPAVISVGLYSCLSAIAVLIPIPAFRKGLYPLVIPASFGEPFTYMTWVGYALLVGLIVILARKVKVSDVKI